jgi:hypothetical protein
MPRSISVGGRRVPTDVVVAPRFKPFGNAGANQMQSRPFEMGASIEACVHEQDQTAAGPGTVGVVVEDINSGERRVLSAGHVLDAMDDDLIQPAILYGGHNRTPPPPKQPPDPKSNVGSVRRIAGGGVDGGIAETTAATPNVIGLGPPTGTYWPMADMPVQKSGASTGVTAGTVTYKSVAFYAANAPKKWLRLFPNIFTGSPPHQPVPSPKDAVMSDLFLVDSAAFCAGGDSGSLVMAGPGAALQAFADDLLSGRPAAERARFAQALQNRAVGLLIGGGSSVTLCQEIDTILNALSVTLVI